MTSEKRGRQNVKNTEPVLDVGLYLRGIDLDPAVITSTLGIAPSKSRVTGEKWITSSKREVTAKVGLWFLDTTTDSPLLRDRLAWLIQQLDRFDGGLTSIPGVQDAEISVFIALAENDRGGGDYEFDLTAEDLASISRLGVPLKFSITYVKP